jgi:hypothetical protein
MNKINKWMGGLLMVMYLPATAQQTIPPCEIPVEAHSFAKGRVHLLRILGKVGHTIEFKDTMIGQRIYYRYQLTGYTRHCYWAEDFDGSIWLYDAYFNTGELCYIPNLPFVGYKVHYGYLESTIVEVGSKRRLPYREYTDLIVCEVKNLRNGEVFYKYFKKGVGWVALESESGSTYLECVTYR